MTTTMTRPGPSVAATASGSGRPASVLALWAAVIVAWAWVSALSVFAYRHVSA